MQYRAWAEGWGPKFYKVAVTRSITHRARLEWQHERGHRCGGRRSVVQRGFKVTPSH
jgi:hypothetical protein